MIQKNFAGVLPRSRAQRGRQGHRRRGDRAAVGRMNTAMQTQQIHEAAGELTTLLNAANLYFADAGAAGA